MASLFALSFAALAGAQAVSVGASASASASVSATSVSVPVSNSATSATTAAAATGTQLTPEYPPLPADLTTPYQQRIGITGPNSMSIGWNTFQDQSSNCVQYGLSSTSLTNKVCSTISTTYDTSRTWSHSVSLTQLKPATKYYYKIVSGNSTVASFLSPRTPGDLTAFNMDVVADLGVYGPDGFTSKKRDAIPAIQPALNHSTIGALARTINDYELVIHPGDFGYSDDWYLTPHNLVDGKDAYQSILEQFYEQLAPVAARKAYMTSPGNHEADCTELDYTSALCPQGQTNFTDFHFRFNNSFGTAFTSKSNSSAARTARSHAQALALPPFWYSFDYGMAHVVMIDTETDFPSAPDGPGGSAGLDGGPFGAPGQQVAFLEADLASVDRTVTPWVIVAGHRPWYSTGSTATSSNICAPCQAAFEDLFYKYGVDLGVFGHVHNSQRFNPVYNNTVDPAGLNNPKAPMYIVAGGAGNIEGLDAPGSNYTGNVFAYGADFSYAQLKFIDAHHLGVEFFESSNGTLLDSSVLYKKHTHQFVVQA